MDLDMDDGEDCEDGTGKRSAGAARASQKPGRRKRRGAAQLVVKGLRKRLGMRVSTLQIFLERMCAEKGREELCKNLAEASPSLVDALQNVLVARDKEAAPIQKEKPSMYPHELVDRAVQEAVRSKLPHVLGYGYRAISQYGGNGVVHSMYGVEATWVNTAVSYLKSWKPLGELHSMVGDAILLHTLVHACVLLPLPNNCFAQLTGPPLSSVVMSLGQPQTTPQAAGGGQGGQGGAAQSSTSIRASQSLRGGIPASAPANLPRGVRTHGYSKRRMPRVATQSRQQQQQQPQQQQNQQQQQQQQQQGMPSRSSSRRPPVLESTLISRTPMYYNSTFGTRAGLPGSHILNKIGSGGRPAAALTMFIFQGKDLGRFGVKKEVEAKTKKKGQQPGGRGGGDSSQGERGRGCSAGRKRKGGIGGRHQELDVGRGGSSCSRSDGANMPVEKRAKLDGTVEKRAKLDGKQGGGQGGMMQRGEGDGGGGAPEGVDGVEMGKVSRIRVGKGLRGALGIVGGMLRRHGRVPYARLLQRHCGFDVGRDGEGQATTSQERGGMAEEENEEMEEDVASGGQEGGQRIPGYESSTPGEWPRTDRYKAPEEGGEYPASQSDMRGRAPPVVVGGGKMLGLGYSRPKGGGEWEDETVSVRQVVSMVRCVLRRLLPRETWGCRDNEAVFARALRSFLSMRRYEKFYVQRAMKGIKLTKCAWLYPEGCRVTAEGHMAARRRMCSWIHFVFTHLVVPLVRASFYVTENEASKMRMTWYRKNVWARVRACCVLGSKYKKLTRAQAAIVAGIPKSCPGALRLLPKGNGKGVRPILNLGRQKFASKANPHGIKSVNFRLREALAVLSLETRRHPSSIGSSLRGQSQMLQALLPVVRNWKKAGRPQMHFASIDIEKSFDTLKVPKLLEVVDQTLVEDEYLVRRYAVWKPDQGLRFKSRAVPASQYNQFVSEAENLAKSTRNCIFTDLVEYSYVNRQDISKLVGQHLQGNVVEMGNKPHLQIGGIPQGSVLSSLLCCMMYGHLEGSRLSSLPSSHRERLVANASKEIGHGQHQVGEDMGVSAHESSVLMRVVDDFLYLSPSASHARAFVRTMGTGNPDYGARVNTKKSKVNFPVKVSVDGDEVELLMLGDGASNGEGLLRWCGLVIDSRRMCVSLDLRRFTGYHIRDALTMPSAPKSRAAANLRPGAFARAIKHKVIAAAKSKFHPILLDQEINPPTQVLLNIYQVLAITAMKHVSYVESSRSKMPASMVLAILRSIHPFIVGISKRKEFMDQGVSVSVRKDDFLWLGLDAYARVLKKKGPAYDRTRTPLESEKAALETGKRYSGEKSVLPWIKKVSRKSWSGELKAVNF